MTQQHLPIWYLGKVPAEVCDRLVAEFQAGGLQDARMGMDGANENHKHRNTAVKFAPFEHPFSGEMEAFAMRANEECGWRYEITQRECIQFAQYGVGQHYEWHTDTFPLSGAELDRKVTVVCLLNDPSEFEGGDFQIRLYSEYSAPLQKGSLIAFPSTLEHRVTPVTNGTRYSATLWTAGPRFK